MGDQERWAQLAGWMLDHLETWKRMCQSGEVERLPLKQETEETCKALEELYELRYFELIMVYFSLNMGVIGDGVLRFLLKQFTDPKKAAELEAMAKEVIETLKKRLGEEC